MSDHDSGSIVLQMPHRRHLKQLLLKTRQTFLSLLCLCVAFWSVVPAIGHGPDFIETLQEHAEMVQDHGHSHGFVEDMLAALHGHDHEAIDHDHSKALAGMATRPRDGLLMASVQQVTLRFEIPNPVFRIDRPPRA